MAQKRVFKTAHRIQTSVHTKMKFFQKKLQQSEG